jgi:hypothetical protein
MLKKDSDEIKRDLMDQAEKRLGRQRATEIQAEIEVMAEQLAVLRATPVEVQDEP